MQRLSGRAAVLAAAVVMLGGMAGTASACHKCGRMPCAYAAPAPAMCMPAYQCVTEMVPYTVMQPRMRLDFREETFTVMRPVPETTFTEVQRVVCRPVFETTTVQRVINVCRPVFETEMVNQNVTVCRPVTTTQQVTEICMEPVTQLVNVAVAAGGKCGRCGHARPACTCQTVAQTCYRPVPVVRDVQVTRMVPEVQTRQVPITRCSIVREQKVIDVPIPHCRIVQEVVTERIPHVTIKCVPQQVTRRIPIPVCETVEVTCYRPVSRMVPVVPMAPMGAPQGYASGQAAPAAQAQSPSGQQ